MALLVQKFGGSSLDGPERLLHAANMIADARKAGNDVIAVVSARGRTTDDLLSAAHALHPDPPPRELDLLLSVGEQVSAAHMALTLCAMGYPAEAMTGWQAGIRTDDTYGNAKIHHVTGGRIRRALSRGSIVIVTGFQGISEAGDITTLGRGGSDTTAVALSAFLKADACLIYTDVDGVFTADPKEVTEARLLPEISYDDMLEMASEGARVLHSRCVEIARDFRIPFEVRSVFTGAPGTLVHETEGIPFCGVAITRGLSLPKSSGPVARVAIVGSGCQEPETAVEVFRALRNLTVFQFSQSPRSVCAYVRDQDAAEAARILHYLFLS